MTLRTGFSLAAALVASFAFCQSNEPLGTHDQSHYFSAFYGKGLLILGSEDTRRGGGFSYAYGRPDRRLSFHGLPAQLVYEGYVDATHSSGVATTPPTPAGDNWAIGFLAYLRYRFPMDSRQGTYFDAGFGIQYVNTTSLDLDLNLNTTPMIGYGIFFPSGKHDIMAGLRLLHISNGGRKRPNFGENQLFLTITTRY